MSKTTARRFRSLEKRPRAELTQRAKPIHSLGQATKRERSALYSTTQWRKSRLAHLQENPLCSFCKQRGKTVPAEVVDHVVPHKSDERLFFDPSNWQSLCNLCHDSDKARLETKWERGEVDSSDLWIAPE